MTELALKQAPCIKQGCVNPPDSGSCEQQPGKHDVKCRTCCRAWAGAWPLSMHVAAQLVLEMSDLMEVPAVHILHCEFPCKLEAMSILGALAASPQVGTAVQTGSPHAKRPVDPA